MIQTVHSIQELEIVKDLAYKIWPIAYCEILSSSQLDYMLSKFYSIEALESQMKLGHVFLLLGEPNHNLGFASYQLNYEPNTCKLHKIYIDSTLQGKGNGKKLLQEVISNAQQNYQKSLILNVNKNNKAITFYQSQGFKIIKEEVIDIGNDYVMDDYVMELGF